MKRIFSYILISVLAFGFFLAPVSSSFHITPEHHVVANTELSVAHAKVEEWGCQPFSGELAGCFTSLLYYVIFTPIAFVASLAGKFLDFFVYYSTNSSSYNSEFVQNGWAAVRDIANIFFIVALLYIAIKTILDLSVSNNKKLISAIVIVALLINFSLFFTQVVIDGSNILAKVFYNNITPVGTNGEKLDPKTEGEKSISVGLMNKFDPQELFSQDEYKATGGQGKFLFVTLIATFVTGYAAFVFFSVGLLFVGRVVSLWLSMIFAPIAFASYTVPFTIPGFGHKEWWKNLLENAFLAPIFIFMLYIIVLFLDTKGIIHYGDNPDVLSSNMFENIMKTVIPFVILMILLMKTKKMAVRFSGEMGEGLAKIGSTVGGFAVGGAIGAGALLGRSTIGRVSNMVGNSERLKNAESKGGPSGWAAGKIRDLGNFGAKASFDVRGTGAMKGVGNPAKDGFAGARERQVTARQQRAKELELGEDSKLKQELNKTQTDLRALQMETGQDVAKIDKQIEDARQNMKDTAGMPSKTEEEKEAKETARAGYFNQLKMLNSQKKALKEGVKFDGGTYRDPNGALAQQPSIDYKEMYGGRSLKSLENAVHEKEHEIEHKNYDRKDSYANSLTTGGAQFVNVATGGSFKGNREASHKIRMGMKAPAGGKSGGGHGYGTDDHGGGHEESHDSHDDHAGDTHGAPAHH